MSGPSAGMMAGIGSCSGRKVWGTQQGCEERGFSFLISFFESAWPSILSQGGILGTLCLADAEVKGSSVVPAPRPCPTLGEGLMVGLGLIHTVCFLQPGA